MPNQNQHPKRKNLPEKRRENLRENLEKAEIINFGKTQYADAIQIHKPLIPELLKNLSLNKTYDNVILIEMAIELADILGIPDRDAYAILIAISDLIDKRNLEGKPSVIRDMLHISPRKLKKGVTLSVRKKQSYEKRLRKFFVAPRDSKARQEVINEIINRISENKRMNNLLYLIFGYPRKG